MYNNKTILAIVTARGGSKGLPEKNIKKLMGKPLIGWTLDSAKKCEYIDEIFVSTDSSEIAEVCKKFGIVVPFLRPSELASDTASSVDVVQHVISQFENINKYFDYILLLEPTSPLRKKNDLKNVIEKIVSNFNADGLITVGEIHMEHPMIVKKLINEEKIIPYIADVEKITQRQQADKAYFPYGVAYIIKTKIFKEKKSFYTDNVIPYCIDRWQNYEVDDIYDFLCIESILKVKKDDL